MARSRCADYIKHSNRPVYTLLCLRAAGNDSLFYGYNLCRGIYFLRNIGNALVNGASKARKNDFLNIKKIIFHVFRLLAVFYCFFDELVEKYNIFVNIFSDTLFLEICEYN